MQGATRLPYGIPSCSLTWLISALQDSRIGRSASSDRLHRSNAPPACLSAFEAAEQRGGGWGYGCRCLRAWLGAPRRDRPSSRHPPSVPSSARNPRSGRLL